MATTQISLPDCTLGCIGAAVAHVHVPGGCVAARGVEDQWLCAQHLISLPDGCLQDEYKILEWLVEWPTLQARFT